MGLCQLKVTMIFTLKPIYLQAHGLTILSYSNIPVLGFQ